MYEVKITTDFDRSFAYFHFTKWEDVVNIFYKLKKIYRIPEHTHIAESIRIKGENGIYIQIQKV